MILINQKQKRFSFKNFGHKSYTGIGATDTKARIMNKLLFKNSTERFLLFLKSKTLILRFSLQEQEVKLISMKESRSSILLIG